MNLEVSFMIMTSLIALCIRGGSESIVFLVALRNYWNISN